MVLGHQMQCGDTLNRFHLLPHMFHVPSSNIFTSSLAFGGLFYYIFYTIYVQNYTIEYNFILSHAFLVESLIRVMY